MVKVKRGFWFMEWCRGHLPSAVFLSNNLYIVEPLAPRGVHPEPPNRPLEGGGLSRMHQRHPGRIPMDDLLRPPVKRRAAWDIHLSLRFHQDLVEFLAPVKRDIARRMDRRTLIQEHIEKVIGISIVPDPAQKGHVVLSTLDLV